MTRLFDCGECATGCYGRCMRAIISEMQPVGKPNTTLEVRVSSGGEISLWSVRDDLLKVRNRLYADCNSNTPEGQYAAVLGPYTLDLLAQVDVLLRDKKPDPMYLLGEMREGGVVWFNQNPHAHPMGTKFYADKKA